MNTYPLIRTKWSNESIMAALYLVLILYHVPVWLKYPKEILGFVLLTLVGLIVDAIINLLHYKRLWCCVSASITAAIISLFTRGVPIWGQALGLICALIFGKHIWGGTGKNRINPAMVGLLIILLFWNSPLEPFMPSYLMLPAIILSLPFLKSRPYAGLGFIAGAFLALLLNNDINVLNLISGGVLFWGCIVMTDPVTVTGRRLGGLIAGSLAGFLAYHIYYDILIIIALVFAVNLFSYIADNFIPASKSKKLKLKIPRAVSNINNTFLDLTEESNRVLMTEEDVLSLTSDEIINIIRDNEVFGMGGAAFPVYQKISSVQASAANEKYLIINGIECDPGLLHDHYLLRNFPDEILRGINILSKCINFSSVYLAVTDLQGLKTFQSIKIHKAPDRYPMGAEKLLIKEVLGQTLETDKRPAQCGILVLNVQTVYSVYKAVYQKQPTDTRLLTVVNLKDKTAKVVKVHLGERLEDITQAIYPGVAGCFAGGGIMEAHFAKEDETVDRSTNFIAVGSLPKYKESVQCSRCGNCIRNCPMGLAVNKIADLVDEGKIDEARTLNAAACISCGCCSYSCLAGRNLAVKIKTAKESDQNYNQR